MIFETIETKRLLLRKLSPEDYRFLFENFSDEDLIHYLGLSNAEALEKEKYKYFHGISTYNKSFVNFQMMEKDSRRIIGMCGFHTWYTEHKRAEIGYHLTDETKKSQGFMSEVIKPILQYGFLKMGLNRIEAFVGTQNKPTIKLVNKFGFVKEGQLRSHYCKEGIIEDSIVYGLLRNEFADVN